MLPFKQFNHNLTADLSRLGLSASTSNMLSESRISEQTYAPAAQQSAESLAYTTESVKPFVDSETLDRIEALIATGNLTPDEAGAIADRLNFLAPKGNKAQLESVMADLNVILESADSIEARLQSVLEGIKTGDVDPIEALEVLIALEDGALDESVSLRDKGIAAIVMNEGFRTMLRKIKGAFKKVRVKKMTSAEKAKARQDYRANRATIALQRAKREKKAVVKKNMGLLAKAREKFGMGESTELAGRLRSRLVSESVNHDEFGMVERIGRIFALISEHVTPDVVKIMEEQYSALRSGLFESSSDLEAACRPCVAIIAECLKDIEQGN